MKTLGISALIIVACIVGFVTFQSFDAVRKEAEQLPRLGNAPAFTLIDAQGNEFSSETLRGKVWLLNFFFTSCPSICPAMQGRVAALYEQFKAADSVHLVSISVDPQNDSTEKLQEYAKTFKADLNRWHFLRGELGKVHAIAREGFKLDPGAVPDMHTVRIVLVDKDFQIRGYYQGTESEAMERLSKALYALTY